MLPPSHPTQGPGRKDRGPRPRPWPGFPFGRLVLGPAMIGAWKEAKPEDVAPVPRNRHRRYGRSISVRNHPVLPGIGAADRGRSDGVFHRETRWKRPRVARVWVCFSEAPSVANFRQIRRRQHRVSGRRTYLAQQPIDRRHRDHMMQRPRPAGCPHLRRRRRAFDLARTCQGARTAVQSARRLDRASTDAERVAADIFSSTIREYSAGEHLPCVTRRQRWPIVSHDASANSAVMTGKKLGFVRLRLLIDLKWDDADDEQIAVRERPS
jgi:hypothetical protein